MNSVIRYPLLVPFMIIPAYLYSIKFAYNSHQELKKMEFENIRLEDRRKIDEMFDSRFMRETKKR